MAKDYRDVTYVPFAKCVKILFCHWMKVAVSNLQVGLLAALNQLVESRRSKVSVDMGRIQPLQSLHDYLLQDKRTEDTFCGPHTELVHVVDSCQTRERMEADLIHAKETKTICLQPNYHHGGSPSLAASPSSHLTSSV